MLQFIFQTRELLDYLLSLVSLLCIVALGYGSVGIIYGAGLV
jgi:hypothetical protein